MSKHDSWFPDEDDWPELEPPNDPTPLIVLVIVTAFLASAFISWWVTR